MSIDKRQNEIIRIQKRRNNFVMLDKGFLEDNRLSYKSKGILAYLLSKPDNWKVVIKDLINHSNDGRKAIYSGLRELKEFGYYKKIPVRDESGRRIDHWESVIFECPEENLDGLVPPEENSLVSQNGKVDENAEKSASSLLTPFVYIENVKERNVEIQNRQHNNNNSSNNNNSNKSVSMSMSMSVSDNKKRPDKDRTIDAEISQYFLGKEKEHSQTDTHQSISLESSLPNNINYSGKSDYNTYEEIIKENIEYECLLQENDVALVDNFIACIIDTLLSDDSDRIKIDGELKPRSLIKSVFMKLRHEHIVHAINQYKVQHRKITYKRPYIRNMLYNTYHEIDAHYVNQVRSDGVV